MHRLKLAPNVESRQCCVTVSSGTVPEEIFARTISKRNTLDIYMAVNLRDCSACSGGCWNGNPYVSYRYFSIMHTTKVAVRNVIKVGFRVIDCGRGARVRTPTAKPKTQSPHHTTPRDNWTKISPSLANDHTTPFNFTQSTKRWLISHPQTRESS
jgi:hypothetical protein